MEAQKVALSEDRQFPSFLREALKKTYPPTAQWVGRATPTACGLWIASLLDTDLPSPLLLIFPEEEQAYAAYQSATFLLPERIILFPSFPQSPFDLTPLPLNILTSWLKGWHALQEKEASMGILPLHTALWQPPHLPSLSLHTYSVMEQEEVVEKLIQWGYRRVSLVQQPGEFSRRGCLMDIFLPHQTSPGRIEWEDDEIISIRSFQVETQRSLQQLDSLTLIPILPFLTDHQDRLQYLREHVTGLGGERWVELLEKGQKWENLFPLYPLWLSPEDSPTYPWVIYDEETLQEKLRYIQKAWADQKESLKESGYFDFPWDVFFKKVSSNLQKALKKIHPFDHPKDNIRFSLQNLGKPKENMANFFQTLKTWKKEKFTLSFAIADPNHRRSIRNLINQEALESIFLWDHLFKEPYIDPKLKIAIIPSQELLDLPPQRSHRGTGAAFLKVLEDLQIGDPVVHVAYGVGRFQGLTHRDGKEYVTLTYSDGTLHIPTDRLDCLIPYVGLEGKPPPLHALGSQTWKRKCDKAKKAAQEIAEKLLYHYAQRKTQKGIPMPGDPWLEQAFKETFPYEETPDQAEVIQAVLADMEEDSPMDRLVCGDVGFGKTEVALRAAFRAVISGYQVLVLAPTTVLAYQHYHTFQKRMTPFSIRVALLSRLVKPKKQKEIMEQVASGTLDILVGTHQLLYKDLQMAKPGLLIIDEEQRFGVLQKEKLLEKRAHQDVLYLTATPIPRTLSMTLGGLRDLSTIESSPPGRRPIETIVTSFNPHLIQEAIQYELQRGGKIFFVSDTIKQLPHLAKLIQQLVPQSNIIITHGKMSPTTLEDRMLQFVEGEGNICLTTTLIENGLDIPQANTMIVINAHRFGMAQLYQLRGRIGRSDQQAYCYFMVPSLNSLTKKASERLQALEEFSHLGSGFKLAARDLELRGGGELLGAQQHGHIQEIGFELFYRLLEEAVNKLKGTPPPERETIDLQLSVPFRIPEDYIPSPSERLSYYRRLTQEPLDPLLEEMVDRFGPLPKAMRELADFFRLRAQAIQLGLKTLHERKDHIFIALKPKKAVNPQAWVEVVQKTPGASMTPQGELTLPVRQKGKKLLHTLKKLFDYVAA